VAREFENAHRQEGSPEANKKQGDPSQRKAKVNQPQTGAQRNARVSSPPRTPGKTIVQKRLRKASQTPESGLAEELLILHPSEVSR
jgi:hypothetical protein